ncbi:hypothetical protein SAMN04488144_1223 [Methylobacterium sp. 190mf]|uniref:hypothetical protein n=1 Tax=Methylobacterium sp. 190mf TaxID=1761798 RepID=UPI00089F8172|nr:hypothetical protein [Methylobacterium sp. 190mf]SEG53849.1 hypothetical protein SAMN04488144_1223 [Methylobacterium sp. 190mf]
MLNKFATRRVVLTYMPADGDKEIFPEINECLSCWTREFFGYVEQIGVLSMYIFVSRNSDLFELVEFIANEILKPQGFEEMQFSITASGSVS